MRVAKQRGLAYGLLLSTIMSSPPPPPPPPLFCFYFLIMILIISVCTAASPHSGIITSSTAAAADAATTPKQSNRKMLASGGVCSNRDISITQSRDPGSGIPQFIVQIVNTCSRSSSSSSSAGISCAPSDIHLHCGWFASAKMVNPRDFKRLGYDDCVVNAGRPLKSSHIVRFTYSNSFMYPLLFKSAKFC